MYFIWHLPMVFPLPNFELYTIELEGALLFHDTYLVEGLFKGGGLFVRQLIEGHTRLLGR